MNSDALKARLEALRQNFIAQLPTRIETLEAGLAKWNESGDEADLSDFHRAAHSLTGAGATFGCQELSDVARALERQLQSPELASDLETVERLLEAVRQAVLEVGAAPFVEPELPASLPPQQASAVQNGRLVYLLEDDPACRSHLSSQVEQFGYEVEVFETALALSQRVEQRCPAAIIADIVLVEGGLAGIDVIRAINAKQKEPIPVVFVSVRDDFEARLEAVRVGGKAYFKKPLSVESLVDVMDQLTAIEEVKPYRILVVDDSETQAEFYADLLDQAGMEVSMVTSAEMVLDAIDEFSPELVLMDMYMPYCSGVELASVIRQQPAYLGLPIVFLSTETDRHAQLEAMRKGGDDFLIKPIKTADLVGSVSVRAERYRILRSRMSQDSLTGLLNHRRIMEGLYGEMARMQRQGGQFVFAMLDLDHFKQVNDSYGHSVGDRVLKGLARLLKQRLRATDIIGRYGGEEFAVIMPDTSLEAATRVIEELREAFAATAHAAEGEIIHVTLSAGIAAAESVADAGELHELADQMLYKAKQNGRNRIVTAKI